MRSISAQCGALLFQAAFRFRVPLLPFAERLGRAGLLLGQPLLVIGNGVALACFRVLLGPIHVRAALPVLLPFAAAPRPRVLVPR